MQKNYDSVRLAMDYDILFIFGAKGLEMLTLPITQLCAGNDGQSGKLANTFHNE
jgi:hypothetical protein